MGLSCFRPKSKMLRRLKGITTWCREVFRLEKDQDSCTCVTFSKQLCGSHNCVTLPKQLQGHAIA